MDERQRVPYCEDMFKSKSKYGFKLPQRKKNQSTHLRVNGKLITDSIQLLETWSEHFQSLYRSRVPSKNRLGDLQQLVTELRSTSFHREDTFLDIPVTEVEVQQIAERKMKLRKASGLDGLTAEHIQYSGHTIIVWLTQIFNATIGFEMIPSVLKTGVTIAVYKGGDKDLLDIQSYHGISLNSVISKTPEILILDLLELFFLVVIISILINLVIKKESLVSMLYLLHRRHYFASCRKNVVSTRAYMTYRRYLTQLKYLFSCSFLLM